jgi:hypothetical protein
MTTLKNLKMKYSGQPIPEWELIAAGLKEAEQTEEPAKRRGRPPKVHTEEEPTNEQP